MVSPPPALSRSPEAAARLSPPGPRHPQGGYALPVVLVGAFMVLLGSLATQSTLHQARLRHASALGQRRLEDALASAAHQLVGRLVAHHPCLLTLPLAAWPGPGRACADAPAQEGLRQADVPALAYRLEGWQPAAAPDGRVARIDLEISRRVDAGDPPWRAAFALDVQGDPPQVLALRELGLRGVRP
jgi:hypothetical protein